MNLVIEAAESVAQDRVQLERSLSRAIGAESQIEVLTKEGQRVLRYLHDKGLVGRAPRKDGRYRDVWVSEQDGSLSLHSIAGKTEFLTVTTTDRWLSEPCVRSTIGAPTKPNIGEIVSLAHQLGLVSFSKNNQTALGYMSKQVRQVSGATDQNPFCLGLELIVLLRVLSAADGPILWRMAHSLLGRSSTTRDEVSMSLSSFFSQAYEDLKTSGAAVEDRREARELWETIDQAVKRASAAKSVGVLEHRTAPRLEWLTDIGVLQKEGPKNTFTYSVTDDCHVLVQAWEASKTQTHKNESLALEYYLRSEIASPLRKTLRFDSTEEAVLWSYGILARRVGSSSIVDVALLAAAACWPLRQSLEDVVSFIVDWSRRQPLIKLSGGRYVRSPELMHIAPQLYGEPA